EPGPLMKTLIDFIPCSMALWAASSAASWAAKGVDLREPLKPFTPADDQATTLPETSVMVTMVLLKEAVMWAMPLWTLLRTFFAFFCFGASGVSAAIWLVLNYGLSARLRLALDCLALARSLAGAGVGVGALAA